MANLTLSIHEETLRRARIRALEQGTTVNALVRGYLESYAGESAAAQGLRAFVELAEHAGGASPSGGRTWTRDDAHAR